jgi:hypothetical protein
MFQRNLLPPSSGQNSSFALKAEVKCSSKTPAITYGTFPFFLLLESFAICMDQWMKSLRSHPLLAFFHDTREQHHTHCENRKSHEDCCLVVWSLVEELTLKTKTVYLSKTSAMIHLPVQHHIPWDSNIRCPLLSELQVLHIYISWAQKFT